jgi:hypothetical protein
MIPGKAFHGAGWGGDGTTIKILLKHGHFFFLSLAKISTQLTAFGVFKTHVVQNTIFRTLGSNNSVQHTVTQSGSVLIKIP